MKKTLKTLIDLLLATAVLISVSLLLTSKNNYTGLRNFTVLSGSMEPNIKTGSIVFDIPKATYDIGDVITFLQNDKTVTHRIVKVISTPTENQYITKGDANNTPDKDSTPQHSVIGKEIFNMSYLGYFAVFLKTLPGLIIFLFIPAIILISIELSNIWQEIKKGNRSEVVVE